MINNIASEMSILSKSDLANLLGVTRSMLYYQGKQDNIDKEVKNQIEAVLADNPAYGHRRIALALKLNKKRIRRVMKKYQIKPYRSRKKPRKRKDENKEKTKYSNLIKNICPIKPNVIWVSDFTYLKYQGRFIYLATVMDLFAREIIGWNVSRFHNQELVLGALEHALDTGRPVPRYLHSDQGSEYDSQSYTNLTTSLGIKISMSGKASPWENGHQESFYANFKLDLGDINQIESLGEVIESISLTIYYYNNKRIHTALKMTPADYRKQYEKSISESVLNDADYLSD